MTNARFQKSRGPVELELRRHGLERVVLWSTVENFTRVCWGDFTTGNCGRSVSEPRQVFAELLFDGAPFHTTPQVQRAGILVDLHARQVRQRGTVEVLVENNKFPVTSPGDPTSATVLSADLFVVRVDRRKARSRDIPAP